MTEFEILKNLFFMCRSVTYGTLIYSAVKKKENDQRLSIHREEVTL